MIFRLEGYTVRTLQGIFIFGGLLFFGTLSILALLAEYGLPWKYDTKAKEMESYLQQRYQDEFEVSEVYFDLMHGSSYAGYAEAQSTGHEFHVQVFRNGEVESSYNSFWSPKVKQLLKNYFTGAATITGDVRFTEPLKNADELAQHLANTCFTVRVDYAISLTEDNTDIHLQQALQNVQKLKQEGFCMEKILIGFNADFIQLDQQQNADILQQTQLHITPIEEIDWE